MSNINHKFNNHNAISSISANDKLKCSKKPPLNKHLSTVSLFNGLFWMFCFIFATVFTVYFTKDIYEKYNKNPVIVSVNSLPTTVEDVPFPAVTICNTNLVKKSVAEEVLRTGSTKDKLILNDICDFNSSWDPINSNNYEGNWSELYSFMLKAHQPCEQMIKVCRWSLGEINCSRIFTTVLTDEGFCCNFNLMPVDYIFRNSENMNINLSNANFPINSYQIDDWHPETGYTLNAPYDVYPFRSPGPGKHLGLTIILDANLDNYYCVTSSSVGFKLLLHNPVEIQKVTDYAFFLPPGVESEILYTPLIRDATENLKTVDVQKRHCYFNNEKSLRYYRKYTKGNCKMECLSDNMLELCGCVSYYLPRNNSVKVCGKMQNECGRDLDGKLTLQKLSSKLVKRCNCFPGCAELSYEKRMSYGKIAGSFRIKTNIIKDTPPEYFRKNMAVVHVYFVDTQFTKFTTSVLYDISDFVSKTGGLFALFLGFSAMSVVEIIYYFTLRLFCSSIRNRRANQQQNSVR